MDGWAGFTDADLKKIKGENEKDGGRSSRGMRPSSGHRRGQQLRRPLVVKSVSQSPPAPLDDSMLLSKTMNKKANESQHDKHTHITNTGTGNTTSQAANTGSHGHSPEDSTGQSPDGSTKPTSEPILTDTEDADEVLDLVTDEEEIFKHEQKSLESFQKQHKMIEEQNKLKREKLAKAIKERAKKAKAESVKLTQLQNELSKLDQLLTVDVSIIRDKIEDASREFFEAQKRYDRAEKEFIEAKIDLHKKMEVKESLTEHLYTVIYQNEMRKSKKLAELMSKLEMEDAEDMPEIIGIEMPHPSLLSPVQLPVGRYGQIGAPTQSPVQQQPVRTQSADSCTQQANQPASPSSPEATGKSDTNQLSSTDASDNKVLDNTKEKEAIQAEVMAKPASVPTVNNNVDIVTADTKLDAETDIKSHAQTDSKLCSKSESQTDSSSDTKLDIQPDAKS